MTFRQVLRHITILKKMNSLRQPDNALNQTEGFIRLNNLHCVHGSYPMAMLNAWDRFNKERGSKNDRPDVYDQQQLFLILEFEFGGSDLENRVLSSMVVAKSILHQVTAALAVAENRLCFEHRNLHLGNVLVKTTLKKKLTFCHNGTKHSLDTKGVLVRIIDNNLARLNLGGVKVFRNIMLNEGMDQWERSDIFRCMLDANKSPESNILWIHYLSDKLRTMKYLGAGGPASKRVQEELASFHKEVLRYSSASDLLDYSPMFKVRV
ncbi:hypothetical protein NHX12_018018 [Muraenolepis orangiensis]|uniref:non-specific serine/threonine protein kinase n=1 Tax=Muraenolepis orangiensis TaxID=630683 RepID=A0A9Q0EVZ4_9TELE|nr:hypothetical protein NHX12_018018 [Muraenolepis orangiensis]